MKKFIVILGHKFIFKDLWMNIGYIEVPSCYCINRNMSTNFCMNCGVSIKTQQVKQYKNLVTGVITSYRDIDSMQDYLKDQMISIYEHEPEGYMDDPVYIYLKQPVCKIELNQSGSIKMGLFDEKYDVHILEKELNKHIPDQLIEKGEYGLWFISEDNTTDINYENILTETERIINLLKTKSDKDEGDDKENEGDSKNI